MNIIYTMLLEPACRTAPWGGTRLRDEFGIENKNLIKNDISDDELIELDLSEADSSEIAEAWVLSCHPDGKSRVKNGEFKGKTLDEVLLENPRWMGRRAAKFNRFPVMVKLIDCKGGTSVHVHPDDEYAADTPDGQGKHDMWYIIDAEPDSEIIYGFTAELTQEEFRLRLEQSTLYEVLSSVKVKAGDVFNLEPGTVHAIGEGILLCEVQQSANTVYRVDDYGRERELNIPEALDVAITLPPTIPPGSTAAPEVLQSGTITPIGQCETFSASHMAVNGRAHIVVGQESFVSAVVVDGAGKVFSDREAFDVKKGGSLFFPSGIGRVTFSGKMDVIITTV